MTDYSTYDRIEAYLADKLSAEDLAAFEKELAGDDDLRTEVHRHQRAHKVISYAYYQDLKDRLRAIDSETAKSKARIRPLLRKVAIAAALVGAVAIAGALWINQSYSNPSIAQDFLAIVPADQFRSVNADKPLTIEDRFAAAEKLFDDGQYDEAAEAYTELAGLPIGYADLAEWNVVLCALATGDREVFDARLQAILDDPSHDYYDRAVALQQKIDTPFYRLAN